MFLDSMARTDLLSPHEKTISPVAKAAVTVRACLLPLEDYNPRMRYVQENQILGVNSHNSGHVGPCALTKTQDSFMYSE